MASSTVKIRRKFTLPVAKPGIYANVPLDDYHSTKLTGDAPSVSSSGLRTLWLKSPAHFFHSWCYNAKAEPTTETAPMKFGRAAHHIFLGEPNFKKHFIARPETILDPKDGQVPWHGARKVCKQWLADQKKARRTVLIGEEIERIRGMGMAMAAEPIVKNLLEGEVECSMVARDPETGIWLRGRPDAIPTFSGEYADLKTTEDITDLGVQRAITSGGLHQQGALIWEICELLGMEFTSFFLVFVESKAPFCVRVIELTEDDLSRGRLQNRYALRKIRECIEAGIWPGPGDGAVRKMQINARERDFIDARLTNAGMITQRGDV